MKLPDDKMQPFRDFLDSYNRCFLEKDIEGLKKFYPAEERELVYFDNHPGNDTRTVRHHLELLADFFSHGKPTESGGVEPVTVEHLDVFGCGESACLCFLARYASFPDPAVRCTLYLESLSGGWRIVHAHYSFVPAE